LALAIAGAIFLLLFLFWPQAAPRSLVRMLAPMLDLPPFTRTRIVSVEPGNALFLRGTPLAA